MSQIIDNLYLTFHYLSAVICQNSSSKWCWQDNLEFHRCLVSYGKCFKMLPGFVGYQHFHVKIIRCRFERNFIKNIWASQCHKDQTGQQVFFVSKSKKYYTTTCFISQGINYDDGRIKHRLHCTVCLLSGATLGFCFAGIFCQIFENLYLVWQTEVKDKTWPKLVRLWPDGLISTFNNVRFHLKHQTEEE